MTIPRKPFVDGFMDGIYDLVRAAKSEAAAEEVLNARLVKKYMDRGHTFDEASSFARFDHFGDPAKTHTAARAALLGGAIVPAAVGLGVLQRRHNDRLEDRIRARVLDKKASAVSGAAATGILKKLRIGGQGLPRLGAGRSFQGATPFSANKLRVPFDGS